MLDMVRRHLQIIIGFPCAALCNNPLNDKIVLLILCTPHFTHDVTHTKPLLTAAIKHIQPGAWAGPWVREGCKPR